VPCKELGQIAIIEEMAMRLDFENYLSSDILVKSDRSSMLNSVEIRSPYLDKNLVEFAFSEVPTSMKVSKSESKIIVAKLAKKLLPHEILGQKKKGFSIPIADWLRHGKYRDVFKEVLYSNECIFDKKIIEKIFKLHDLGLNNSERLFALFQIELWRKRNNINF
jgi:asparagine synthase (glutamine-hydrolysing)